MRSVWYSSWQLGRQMADLNLSSNDYHVQEFQNGLFYWAIKKGARRSDLGNLSVNAVILGDADGQPMFYVTTRKPECTNILSLPGPSGAAAAVGTHAAGAIAGAVVAGLAVYFLMKRKRKIL